MRRIPTTNSAGHRKPADALLRPYRTFADLAEQAVREFDETTVTGADFCRRDAIARKLYADLHALVRADRFQAVLYHDTEIALQRFWQAEREGLIDAVCAGAMAEAAE